MEVFCQNDSRAPVAGIVVDAIHSRSYVCLGIIGGQRESGFYGNTWFPRARTGGAFHAYFHAIHKIVYHYSARVARSIELQKSPAACLLGGHRQINAIVRSQTMPVCDVLDGATNPGQQPFITAKPQLRSRVVSVHDRPLRALRKLRGNPGNSTGRPRINECRLATGNRCSTSRNRTFLPAYRTERKQQARPWDPRRSSSKY